MTEQAANSKPVILLADDSKLVRFTAGKILNDEFQLLLAEDGAEGWETLCANDSIQLVLSDLQMPVLDGFGLLEKIRAAEDSRIRELPVIMVTGAENKDGPKERAMELGATDFIGKPFDHADLKARVRAHVGHQQQTRTLMEQVNVDAVTGLLNREAFDDRLVKDVAFAQRHHHSLAVMQIQLDDYRKLFEVIGRGGYDAVIKQVADLLQQSVRREDTIARAGLAQFLVSLPTARPDAANEMARRIAAQVEALEVRAGGEPWRLSLSVGVFAAQQVTDLSADSILHSVREALELSMDQGNSHISVVGANGPVDLRPFSLDQLLDSVRRTGSAPPDINPDQLADAIGPLLALLTPQQRQQLLK